MHDKNTVKNILKNQGALTIDMCEAFVRGEPKILYADDCAVFLIHGCGVYMLWAENTDSAKNALRVVKTVPHLCVVHGMPAYNAYVQTYGKQHEDGFCTQYCWSKREKFAVPSNFTFRPMRMDEIPFIQEHYHLSTNTEYLKWRISENELHGAVSPGGNIMGFIGSHSDGSIGMLEVLPEYRRRGIGTALEYYQMNRHMERGWTPYGQVFLDNPESHSLQGKVGMDFSKDIICWMGDD